MHLLHEACDETPRVPLATSAAVAAGSPAVSGEEAAFQLVGAGRAAELCRLRGWDCSQEAVLAEGEVRFAVQ